jgi:hypothetical protein
MGRRFKLWVRGIPVFNFFYPLPGYLATVFVYTGLSLESALKLLMIITFLLAPLSMFLLLSRFADASASFLGALLYGLAPYQRLNTFVRGDIGESLSLSIIPLALFFYVSSVKNKRMIHLSIAGFLASCIILAHHGVGLMSIPFIIIFLLFATYRHNVSFVYPGIFIVLWLGISAYFWIPALIEHKYTLASVFIGDMYKQHFLSFPEFITKPWGFGANVNASGGLAPQIGFLPFVILLTSIILSKKRQRNLLIIALLILFISSLFLTTSASEFVWQKFSLLQKYQFPWRFMAIPSLTLPILVGILFPFKKKSVIVFLAFLIIGSSFPYRDSGNYTHQPDEWYENFPGTTFYHGQTFTIWSEGGASAYPKEQIEVIEGQASIQNIHKKTQIISATIIAKTDANIRFNTLYYPGWRAYINETQTQIQFQDSNNRGIITVHVPSGEHIVYIRFTETKLRLFANVITLLSVFIACILFVCSKKQHGFSLG